MLVRDYFAWKEDEEGDQYRWFYGGGKFTHWSPVEYSESGMRLLEELLRFFEPPHLYNLSPYLQSAPFGTDAGREFVERFAEWILRGWPHLYPPNEWRERVYARAAEALPQAVRLLKCIDRLNEVRSHERVRERILPVLHELAIDRWGSGRKPYPSIEAAVAAGSKEAELYVILEMKQRARLAQT